jgi:hypothetical protein
MLLRNSIMGFVGISDGVTGLTGVWINSVDDLVPALPVLGFTILGIGDGLPNIQEMLADGF